MTFMLPLLPPPSPSSFLNGRSIDSSLWFVLSTSQFVIAGFQSANRQLGSLFRAIKHRCASTLQLTQSLLKSLLDPCPFPLLFLLLLFSFLALFSRALLLGVLSDRNYSILNIAAWSKNDYAQSRTVVAMKLAYDVSAIFFRHFF